MFDEKLARRRYHRHKCVAKQRNIVFDLTYNEWINIWLSSGKYDLMGSGNGKFCMSRKNDIGPYAIGNVFIQMHTKNIVDALKGKKKTQEHIQNWRQSWYENRSQIIN